ncbi:LacI family DNA-binding transcriptional regulator [Microbacterium sp. 22242]|uniref:LacI family DNA-binding transcriptional regulator n=1 Tax=Microbacterium sp. 22242 TaxID=3453896 RepID=UPI003F85C314
MPEAGSRAKRVSMTDVARQAGVSQKTVSRVVNEEPYVTDPVRERVLEVIERLGFQPNEAARALVAGRGRRIGVVAMGGSTFFGPTSVLAGVEAVARGAGYALSVIRTDPGAGDDIQEAINALVGQGSEAIVLSEPVDFGTGPLSIPDGIEALTFGMEPVTSHPRELVVGADERGGSRTAAEHLLVQGHRTVHHIAGPMNWLASHSRLAGWRSALEDDGVEISDPLVGDWTPQSGYHAMTTLLETTDCTAVFVANDQMAIGAMSAIEAAGRRVGEDVAVVGFDDIDVAAYLSVPLTTVRQDFAEISRIGMHRLLRALEGHAPESLQRALPAQLVIRESSSTPSSAR